MRESPQTILVRKTGENKFSIVIERAYFDLDGELVAFLKSEPIAVDLSNTQTGNVSRYECSVLTPFGLK